MKAIPLFFALSGLSVAAFAQEADWSRAQRVGITLSSFKYQPSTISLEHGKPYVLHLVNTAGGGHDFVAKRFFAAATLAPADRSKVRNGVIEVDGGGAADVRLVAPGPGVYEVHCSHFMHSTFGMKGEIEVR